MSSFYHIRSYWLLLLALMVFGCSVPSKKDENVSIEMSKVSQYEDAGGHELDYSYELDSLLKREQEGRRCSTMNESELSQRRCKYFFENGEVRVIVDYIQKDGEEVIQGVFKEFYKNGEKKKEGGYLQGMPFGKWAYYDKSGQLKRAAEYEILKGDSLTGSDHISFKNRLGFANGTGNPIRDKGYWPNFKIRDDTVLKGEGLLLVIHPYKNSGEKRREWMGVNVGGFNGTFGLENPSETMKFRERLEGDSVTINIPVDNKPAGKNTIRGIMRCYDILSRDSIDFGKHFFFEKEFFIRSSP